MTVLNFLDLKPAGLYRELLRVPALSMGLYHHEPGEAAPQEPHNEDEVYAVLSGRGVIDMAGIDQPVENGSVIYIPAGMPHHFHSVTETLRVLVIFAPAEGTEEP